MLSEDNRILTDNSPDHARGPRLYIAACPAGVVVRVGSGVAEETAAAVASAAAGLPPVIAGAAIAAGPFIALLAREKPVVRREAGLTWLLAGAARPPDHTNLVHSGTAEAAALTRRLEESGMPGEVVQAGFRTVDDFWPPWCVALDGGELASVAFAARLGSDAADVGVHTSPRFRGRGLAAAATAGWARHPDLAGRTLFYSTSVANLSSRRVVERLRLRLLGATLRLT